MILKYQKIVELRNKIISESKGSLPRMDMFKLYMLAEMRVQTIIMAYSNQNKRFIDSTKKQVDDLIIEVDESIEKEYGNKKT